MNELTVYARTLGCPKNRVDTERALGSLGPIQLVETPQEAQLVFVNTCAFIRPAVEESVDTILDLAEEVRTCEPRPLFVVSGCLPGRYGTDVETELPEVDLWLPLEEEFNWAEKIDAALQRNTHEQARLLSTGPSYAYLKIGEGCSHRCDFCTIPFIRGDARSTPPDQLVAEAGAMLDAGAKELVLVAQDTSVYGKDLGLENGLAQLVDRLAALDKLEWLRIMYLYPAGVTDSLLGFLRDVGRPFVPYFDIPLQHAHPDVLKSMGRPFARDPRRVVDKVRRYFPEAALRSSLIVGYPGETEEHFQALLDFIRETKFSHLGIFEYQPEDGTPAAVRENQVEEAVKRKRYEIAMQVQEEISARWLSEFTYENLDVLIDAPSPEWPGLYLGRAWFQAPEADGITYISGEDLQPGNIYSAEIVEAKTYDLVGLA